MENELKLLLLEDDPMDAELIQKLLKRSGLEFNAVVASDETQFHAALENNNFHAVLADNALPQYSSMEALKLISATNPHVAFILVTGTVSEEFAVNIMQQGADDYILKTNLTRLPAAITNAISKKRMQHDKELAKKETEKEKELSESVINSLPGVFFLCNREGNILRWNNNLEIISGYDSKVIAAGRPGDLFLGLSNDLSILFNENKKISHQGIEATFLTKDNKRIPYYFTGMPVIFEDKECFICVGLDISASKQSEQQLKLLNEDLKKLTSELRSVTSHMERIREDEQARIAREVHDQLGQQLTGLKMDMAWLKSKAKHSLDPDIFIEKITDMSQMVDEAIATVRRVASDLRPSIIDDFGLAEALEWEGKKFSKRSGIPVDFKQPSTPVEVHPSISIVLYRIYQEALTNAARHAEPKKITTVLKQVNNELILSISDDGKGFDNTKRITTLGLLGMKERAHMIGGKLTITSEPGSGTTVSVSVPQ